MGMKQIFEKISDWYYGQDRFTQFWIEIFGLALVGLAFVFVFNWLWELLCN